MTPDKRNSIQELLVFPSVDYIILTEHQLSAKFRPDEIIKSGWAFHTLYLALSRPSLRGDTGDSGTEADSAGTPHA